MKTADRRSAVRFLPGGIRARLFLLIALALLPMLLLIAWVYRDRYETRRTLALQTELEVAQALAATFAAHLEDVRRSSLAVGAAITTFEPYTAAKATRILRIVAGEYRTMRNLSWVAPDGVVLASSQPGFVGSRLAERGYFRAIVAGRPFAIGDLTRRGTLSSEPTFGIATAVRSAAGDLRGVVVAGIEPSRLGVLTSTVRRPGRGVFAIFDRQGTLVFHSRGAFAWEERARWRQTDPLLDRALATGRAQIGRVRLPVPGGEWLSARVPLAATGWVVGTGRPYADAIAPVREKLLHDVTTAAVITFSAFLLAWLLARNIALPLLHLAADARTMGAGQRIDRSTPEAPDEVLQLRASVVLMAENLRQRAEALRRSEERYRLVSLATNDVIWDWDLTTDELFWGQALENVFGYPLAAVPQAIGWWYDHLHAEDRERVGAGLHAVIDGGGRTWTDEYRFRRADGSYATVLDRGHIQRDAEGQPLRMVGSMLDLTERRRSEEALRASETRFRALFEQAAVGMGLVNLTDACWIEVNAAFCRMLGYSEEEMRATPWPQITHPEDVEIDLDSFRRLAAGDLDSYSVEKRFIRKDGTPVWARLTLSVVRDQNGRPDYEIAIVVNITARKEAEAELQRTTALLRAVMESTPDFVFVKDRQGRMLLANPATLRDLGKSAGEVIGRTDAEFLGGEGARRIMENDRLVMASGRTQAIEEVPHPDGDRRVYLSTKSPWRDRDGNVVGLVGVSRDITERKQAEKELRALKDHLERRVQERTAELTALNQEMETFSYTVSHDLRAPLRHVTSFAKLLEKSAGARLDEEGRKYVRIIGDASRRMAALIDDLLNFSRLGRAAITKVRVDVAALVEEVRRELAPEAGRRAIDWRIAPLPPAEGDVGLLRTVWTNLLGNALKYTRQRDPAVIEIGGRGDGSDSLFFVRDNGAGFDMRYADKLFGVFQRLHPETEFEGTGIGLASVRRIVERHGGRVWAEGEVGKGATFYFSLPLSGGGT